MSVVILIGRIFLAMIFMGSAFGGHFGQTEATAAYAEMRGVKKARFMTLLSGALMTMVGLGVILGVWIDVAALGMAALSLVIAFMIHHFWTDTDEMTKQVEMSMFMKNLSIAGGAIILFGFATAAGSSLGLTITEPLFSFDL